MLQKEGLIKCCVLRPRRLYHFVLHFQFNNNLLFCLCKLCATECNTDGECEYETVTERTLTGTWVIDKVRLAVRKVYEFIKIF